MLNILLTAHADLDLALNAINKRLLFKFILKPWNNEDLVIVIRRALEYKAMARKNSKLQKELEKRDKFLEALELKYPGITSVRKETSGCIVIEEDKK